MKRWPEILIPRFRHLDNEFAERSSFEEMPHKDRQAVSLARLNSAWAVARTQTAHYGELAARLRLPEKFQSLEEFRETIPLTEKHDVKACPEAFMVGGIAGEWMMTGGSTGEPMRVFWGKEGKLESLRDQYWARHKWGVEPFDPLAMLWGHSHVFARGWRGTWKRMASPIVDRIRNRRRLSAYSLDRETLRRYYDQWRSFGPKALYAYASAGYLFALANEDRPPYDPVMKAALLAAEPILGHYRQKVREVLRCPAVGEYGSIECGMLAYEYPATEGYHVFERSILMETIPLSTGVYEILVTQLRNTGFPLVRYRIGDTTGRPLRFDANGHPCLTDVNGRTHDMLFTPSGRTCHAEMLTHVIEQLDGVAMFRVHQYRDYRLDVMVQMLPGKELGAGAKRKTVDLILGVLGEDVAVRLIPADSLPRTIAGKHRWITSEVERTPLLKS